MMKYFFLLGLALSLSLGLNAGVAIFSGIGVVTKDPEYVSLKITVSSVCYGTPRDAHESNDDAVRDIQGYLEENLPEITGPYDKILTHGGFTKAYEKTIYDGGESRTICSGTYAKSTVLTFKTSDIKNISATLANIQWRVLSTYAKEGEGAQKPVTFASISTPQPRVCRETEEEMRLEAIKLATLNAQQRFWASAQKCGITDGVTLLSISDSFRAPSPIEHSYRDISGTSGELMGVVAIEFSPIEESAKVEVKFSLPEQTILKSFSNLDFN